MTTPEPDRECVASHPRRLQYTLRTLFALTTAAAIACAVFFTLPPWVSIVAAVCVVISMPAVLTVMLVYGRGYTRTFCIGALFPAGLLLVACRRVLRPPDRRQFTHRGLRFPRTEHRRACLSQCIFRGGSRQRAARGWHPAADGGRPADGPATVVNRGSVGNISAVAGLPTEPHRSTAGLRAWGETFGPASARSGDLRRARAGRRAACAKE